MFLNLFVSIGCAVVICHSAYKPTGSTNTPSLNWPLPWPARNKKRFEASLYVRNTKGDVTVMNISREKKYFHDLVQYPKQTEFFTCPMLQNVL